MRVLLIVILSFIVLGIILFEAWPRHPHPPAIENIPRSIEQPEISDEDKQEHTSWITGWTYPKKAFFKDNVLYIDAFYDLGLIAAIAIADDDPKLDPMVAENHPIDISDKRIIENGLRDHRIELPQAQIKLHQICVEPTFTSELPYSNVDFQWSSVSAPEYQTVRLTIRGWSETEVRNIQNNHQILLVVIDTYDSVDVIPIEFRD